MGQFTLKTSNAKLVPSASAIIYYYFGNNAKSGYCVLYKQVSSHLCCVDLEGLDNGGLSCLDHAVHLDHLTIR